MLLKEYKEALESHNRYKVTNTELAKVLNTSSQNISKRIKNNSELTTTELTKLEMAYGFFILPCNYVLGDLSIRQADFSEEYSTWGSRLEKVQAKNSISGYEMARLLNISIDEWDNIICNDAKLPLDFIKNIANNFDVDLNWLFLGQSVCRPPEYKQVEEKLTQKLNKMELALKNAGILTD